MNEQSEWTGPGKMRVRQTRTFAEWLEALRDHEARARINIRIRRLSLGNPGDVRPVGQGVSELRIAYGPGYRVYYTQVGTEIVLLLCGGDKSSQRQDIAMAHKSAGEV